jgi:hypothetical protein
LPIVEPFPSAPAGLDIYIIIPGYVVVVVVVVVVLLRVVFIGPFLSLFHPLFGGLLSARCRSVFTAESGFRQSVDVVK